MNNNDEDFIDPNEDDAEAGEVDPNPETLADGDKKTSDKKGDDDARAELASLRARLNESEQATRYWHEQARGAPAKAAPAEVKDQPLSVDLVEAISTGDKQAIAKAMGELGFVSRGEMDRHIAAAKSQSITEAQIMREFPDLARNDSEFFKATQKHFAELVADGMDSGSLVTTKAAAKLAKAEMSSESGRGDRIRRQSGDRGSRASSRGRDGGSDELDNQQMSIVQRFAAVGAPVTVEGYKKRASSGVNMSGVRTRRAG